MLWYVLIGLCLSLAGVADLQFVYMFYLDRLDGERKKRLHELEQRCKKLSMRLSEAEEKIARQTEMIGTFGIDVRQDEEAWADLLDEG